MAPKRSADDFSLPERKKAHVESAAHVETPTRPTAADDLALPMRMKAHVESTPVEAPASPAHDESAHVEAPEPRAHAFWETRSSSPGETVFEPSEYSERSERNDAIFSAAEERMPNTSAKVRKAAAIDSIHKRLGYGIEKFLQPRLQPKERVNDEWKTRAPTTWSRRLIIALQNLVWHRVAKIEVNNRLAAMVKQRQQAERMVGEDMAVRVSEVHAVTDVFVGMGRKLESLED